MLEADDSRYDSSLSPVSLCCTTTAPCSFGQPWLDSLGFREKDKQAGTETRDRQMWNEEGVGGKEEGDHQDGEGYRKGQGEQDPHASCLCKGHSTHYCTLLFGADKKTQF